MSKHLIAPHGGGSLSELIADDERREELKTASRDWPSWDLMPRQLCDLELLMKRRILATPGIPRRVRIRLRVRGHAAVGHNVVARAGHARPAGGRRKGARQRAKTGPA